MKVYILASLVPVILVLIFGDSMYVGLWYYILIPIVAWILVTPLQPNSSFFSGMGVAIALSYTPFLISNLISDIPDGFILFWHLFSLPGIVVGALVGAYSCIELCTPPLPEFDRSLNFYQKNGLIPVGGRKMRHTLA